jgi:hypothetical protein
VPIQNYNPKTHTISPWRIIQLQDIADCFRRAVNRLEFTINEGGSIDKPRVKHQLAKIRSLTRILRDAIDGDAASNDELDRRLHDHIVGRWERD